MHKVRKLYRDATVTFLFKTNTACMLYQLSVSENKRPEFAKSLSIKVEWRISKPISDHEHYGPIGQNISCISIITKHLKISNHVLLFTNTSISTESSNNLTARGILPLLRHLHKIRLVRFIMRLIFNILIKIKLHVSVLKFNLRIIFGVARNGSSEESCSEQVFHHSSPTNKVWNVDLSNLQKLVVEVAQTIIPWMDQLYDIPGAGCS
uniref:Uncharacterized protein n=1 Tax=Cucumis melo TaxID=3656 RepID=A0A9I9EC22_CUCME